jgi:uncharacterized protein (DUF2336 family)
MAAGTSAALIPELEDAFARCPKDQRALVIGEVIKLFLAQPKENVRQLSSFDEVLACLIRQAEVADLTKLSNAVVASRLMLSKAVRQLAFHEDASVAIPILRGSNWISDEDLNELAETRDQEHLLAISSRSQLSRALTTTLVMRGNASVHISISRNLGARLTEGAFTVLLKIGERDEELAQALGKRSDLPATLVRKFLALVTGKPRLAFLRFASPEICTMTEREAPPKAKAQRDYASAEKEVGCLSRTGQLTDSTVNRFAVGQDHEKLTAALALLSQAPITVIERLLCGDSVDELVVACKAARLRWATTASIIRHRQGCEPISEQQLEERRKLFDSLSLSEAQWTIRFGKTDTSADGCAKPNKSATKCK